MADKQSIYLQHIRQRYPELPVQSVRFLGRVGQYNDILILNEEIVFRFPRSIKSIDGLAVEKAILSRIQAGVPLPVPRPVYTSSGTGAVGSVFVGYPFIPGRWLTRDLLDGLVRHHRRILAQQLASFMRALHDFPETYFGIELPQKDAIETWAVMYAQIQEHLYKLMRPDARAAVDEQFRSVLNHPEKLAFTPRLRHGDFGPTNILFDERKGKISGIIDFSEAGMGDPAVDLAAVSLYGEEFVAEMLPVYPELAEMAPRAAFYRSTFALQEALAGALDHDPEALDAGLMAYR